jgi:VIT1/CCC1 family predicted Fe2+/Mn2+ transporter
MRSHHEGHRRERLGWLRAAVLGANDGLISTASLVVGVSAANLDPGGVMLTGIAGLVGGALSMAAGEYVSVSSQADSERADLARERDELARLPESELKELTNIYVSRGLTLPVAEEVARQLSAHDALGAHARDELGITDLSRARPLQAALASALAFAAGALLPLVMIKISPHESLTVWVSASTLVALVALGALSAKLGAAPMLRPALRVGLWGAVAMGATALIGSLFSVAGPL